MRVSPFMVRRLNHRFKKFLAMNVVTGSALTARGCDSYVNRIPLSILFWPESHFSGALILRSVPEAIVYGRYYAAFLPLIPTHACQLLR